MPNPSRGSDATAAIAAFSMLAAPAAVGVANAHATSATSDAAEVKCVAADGARVERRLGGTADIAFTLAKGQRVTVLDRRDDKAHIRYRGETRNRVGWVSAATLADCVAPPPTSPTPGSPVLTRNPPTPGSSETSSANDLPPLAAGQMRAHYIDVGQGASTLYEFSCGAVLVDTGGESEGDFDSNPALRAYLTAFFEARPELDRTINLLVISHPHIDHAHGADLVSKEFKVKNVVTDGLVKDPNGVTYSGGDQQEALQRWAKEHAKLETIAAADIPKGGKTDGIIDPLACSDEDPKIRALWGAVSPQPAEWTAAAFKNANNHSVALRIDFGKASFLTTGDLQLDATPKFLALHANSDALDADVWEVSHHGSANGCDDSTLSAITPNIAVLGTGDPVRHGTFTAFAFGHPRKTIITELQQSVTTKRPEVHVPVGLGVRDFQDFDLTKAIYATGWDGTVVVTATTSGDYTVRTSR